MEVVALLTSPSHRRRGTWRLQCKQCKVTIDVNGWGLIKVPIPLICASSFPALMLPWAFGGDMVSIG